MADPDTVVPIYLFVSSIKKKFTTLVGLYFDSTFTSPIPPYVSLDIWDRAKCGRSQITACRRLISDAVEGLKPGEGEMTVKSPPNDGNFQSFDMLRIRAVRGVPSEITRKTKEAIEGSIDASVDLYLVCMRQPRIGKSVKWDGSLEKTLQPHVVLQELDFDFDDSVYIHDNYAAAEAHAKELMVRTCENYGDCCVWVWYTEGKPDPLGLHDTLVGATYNKDTNELLDLFLVKKVVATMVRRLYEKITDEDRKAV